MFEQYANRAWYARKKEDLGKCQHRIKSFLKVESGQSGKFLRKNTALPLPVTHMANWISKVLQKHSDNCRRRIIDL